VRTTFSLAGWLQLSFASPDVVFAANSIDLPHVLQ